MKHFVAHRSRSMKKHFTHTLIFLLILGFTQFDASASHVMGGDISWEPAKGDAFKVQITIYRDCHGVSLETPEFETKCAASQKKLNPKVSLLNKKKEDVTPICDKFCSSCEDNCSSPRVFQYGIQKIQATYLVNLSNVNCCKVQFDYQNCCRSKKISTGNGKQNFYIKAWLNKCKAPNHTSPEFSNEPLGIICSGKPYVANQGTSIKRTNSEDSVVFQMTKPLQAPGIPFQYNSPYSFKKPIKFEGFPNKGLDFPAGFHTNNQTGNIKFSPTKVGQTTVMAFEANEYKNGSQICHVRRDMQFSTIACKGNSAPSISGLNCSQTSGVATCPGDTSNFSVCIKDADKKDSLMFTLKDHAIPGQLSYKRKKVNPSQYQLDFTWIPPEGTRKSGQFTFYLQAKDDNCPLNGVAGKSFKLKLKKQPVPAISKENIQCRVYQLKAKPQQFKTKDLEYRWNFDGQLESKFESFYYQIENPGDQSFSLNLKSPQCQNTIRDTLKTDGVIQVDLGNDTTLCSNASIQLTGKAKNNRGKTQYLWHDGMTGKQTRTFKNLTKDTIIYLTVKDSACSFTDTVNVTINPKPELSLGKNQYLCKGDTLSLSIEEADYQNTNPEPPFVKRQINQTINYQWTFLPTSKKLKKQGQSAFLFKGGKHKLAIENTFGCKDTDTLMLSKPPKEEIGSIPDPICQGDTGVLVPESSELPTGNWDANYTWVNLSSQTKQHQRVITVKPKDSLNYRLISKWTNPAFSGDKCKITATVKEELSEKPNILIDSLPKLCANQKPVNLSPFAHPKGGYWASGSTSNLNNNNIDPVRFQPGNHALTYHYQDTLSGCKNQKTTSIFIRKPPEINAGHDTLVCPGKGPILLEGSPQIPNANWEGDGITTINGKPYFDPSKSTVDSGINQLIYKIPGTSINPCSNVDTKAIEVIKPSQGNRPKKINLCPSDTHLYKLSKAFSKTGQWYSKANNISIQQGKLIKKKKDLTGKYKAYYKPHNQCSYSDTVILKILPSPDVKLVKPDLKKYCKGSKPVQVKAKPKGGQWKGAGISNNKFYPQKAGVGSHVIHYEKTANYGCKAKGSMKIKVSPDPSLHFNKNLIDICSDEQKVPFEVTFNNAKQVNFNSGIGQVDDYLTIIKQAETNLKGSIDKIPQKSGERSFSLKAKAIGNHSSCPVQKDSTKIRIHPDPELNFYSTAQRKACKSEFFSVDETIKNDSKVSLKQYNWHVGGKNYSGSSPEIKLNSPGHHDVSLIGETTSGCIDTVKKEEFFHVLPAPEPNFKANKVKQTLSNKVKFINLTDTFGKQTHYNWIFKNQKGKSFTKKSADPKVEFRDTGKFDVSLLAKNSYGCKNKVTKEQYIEILPDPMVYIPNAFTPNGDGKNDQYRVEMKYFNNFKLRIFNNWGETLYLATSYKDHGWKGKYMGKPVPTGSYMYKLKVQGLNNNTYQYSGSLNLIR